MIHQVVVNSLDKEPVCQDEDDFFRLSIYLIDLSDIVTIHELAKKMAVSFPQINALSLHFKCLCEASLQEVKGTISFFSNLSVLEFDFWPGEYNITGPTTQIPEDIAKAHAHVQEWTTVCPELTLVRFMGRPPLFRDGEEDEWAILTL